MLPEDGVPGAFHLGARVLGAEDVLVGVASLSPAPTPHRPGSRAWRLRAMAVTPAAQGKGVGRALVTESVHRVRAEGAAVLWANARDTAVGFYQCLGWKVEGEGHLSVGLPHHTVVLDL